MPIPVVLFSAHARFPELGSFREVLEVRHRRRGADRQQEVESPPDLPFEEVPTWSSVVASGTRERGTAAWTSAAAHPGRTSREPLTPSQGSASPVSLLLREGWSRGENVMDGLRIQATDQALHALQARVGALAASTDLERIADFFCGQGELTAAMVVARVIHTPAMDDVRQALRLVWAALHSWTPEPGEPPAEVGHANMHVALAHNLADCANDDGTFVCNAGHRGQMVKALAGHVAEVRAVPMTPQELVNEIGAAVQRELAGAQPSAAQLDAFERRCWEQARSLYGPESPLLGDLEAHVHAARTALDA